MATKRSDGFIQFGVLLVVALVAMGSLAVVSEKQNSSKNTAVLSRSDENEGEGLEVNSGPGNLNQERLRNESLLPKRLESPQPRIEKSVQNISPRANDLAKTRIEQKRTSSDILRNGKNLRIESENGVVKLRVENKNGTETEQDFEDDSEFKLQGELEDVSFETEEDKFVIKQDKIRVKTGFPLSVNLETNELIVTTPAGTKTVTVLPQQAIDNLMRSKKINLILPEPSVSPDPSASPEKSPIATGEGELATTVESEIEIQEKNGEVFYVIRGAKEKKFLGVFKVFVPKTFEVSTETGEVRDATQSFVSTLLDIFSF